MDKYHLFNIFKNPLVTLLFIVLIHIAVFKQVVSIWVSYATLELYNYLLITPIVLIIVYLNVFRKISFEYFHEKYLSYSILYLTSSFLILYSAMSEIYADQLIILGFVMILHSLLVLFSDRSCLLKTLLVIPALLILVPVPQTILYNFSAILTRYLLDLAIPLSNFLRIPLSVVETSGYIIVNIVHGNEIAQFNIAPVCSGIIGLFSVIAVSPLIVVVSFNGENSLVRKIVSSITGVVLFTLLMFISNVIRLVLVFYFTSLFGLETGYRIFHYTPEVVLVVPIVFIVIKIIDFIAGNVSLLSRNNRIVLNKTISFNFNKLHVVLIPIIFLILLAIPLTSIAYQKPDSIFIHTFDGPVMLFNTSKGLKEILIPSMYRGVSIEYAGRDYETERLLGSMHRIHLYRGIIEEGKYLDIYIEFSTHPTIHIWELCLWWQNIDVYNSEMLYVKDPSGSILYSARVLYYRSEYLNGVLSSWRNKYYTEKGLELSRFTIMINSFYKNITYSDISILKELTNELIIKSGEASISKYSKIAGFDISYYYYVIIPFTVLITVLIFMREKLLIVFKKWAVNRHRLEVN